MWVSSNTWRLKNIKCAILRNYEQTGKGAYPLIFPFLLVFPHPGFSRIDIFIGIRRALHLLSRFISYANDFYTT